MDTAAGWSASAHRPDNDGLPEKKSTSTSFNLVCGLQIAVDYAIWGALQQRVYHQPQFKTVEELKRAIVTEWQKNSHSVSLITVGLSMNGVDVLKLLSGMAADIATWLK